MRLITLSFKRIVEGRFLFLTEGSFFVKLVANVLFKNSKISELKICIFFSSRLLKLAK